VRCGVLPSTGHTFGPVANDMCSRRRSGRSRLPAPVGPPGAARGPWMPKASRAHALHGHRPMTQAYACRSAPPGGLVEPMVTQRALLSPSGPDGSPSGKRLLTYRPSEPPTSERERRRGVPADPGLPHASACSVSAEQALPPRSRPSEA
jgi:hypothetical protein